MSPLDIPLTQSEFGALVGVSQQAVSDLIDRGTLTRDAMAAVWLREYVSNLREVAAGRYAAGDYDLAGERARLAKEQADRIAMQNAVTRRESAPTALIQEILTRTAARVNVVFEALPSGLRRAFPDIPAGAIDGIGREIARARNIVAEICVADLFDDDAVDENPTFIEAVGIEQN